MKSRPIYDDGRLHVRERQCATCVFRPGNLMRLRPGRVEEMVAAGPFACHKTTHGAAPQEAVCWGYWDAHRFDTLAGRLAVMLDIVTTVR